MVSSPHRRSRKMFKERMEKGSLLTPKRNRCFFILFTIVLWWLICFFNFTTIFPSTDVVARSTASSVVQIPLFGSQKGESLRSSFLPTPRKYSEPSPIQQTKKPIEFTPLNKHIWQPMKMFRQKGDPCAGKYVYMHELPSEFNQDMLDNCRNLSLWTNMCKFIANAGLGPPLEDSEGAFSEHGWFATNQFATEVIFHNRMKQYDCLINDSSKAAAIFVPFYAGLDISRYLWGASIAVRDSASLGLTRWLQDRPEWKSLNGRDHFVIAGRITWDFRRKTDDEKDWGNKLLILPALKNMSTLVIESSPWHHNDFGIPYPTYFHPSQDSDIVEWQNRMRTVQRSALFSFAGAPRPEIGTSIRGQIMDQCRQSDRCRLLECDFGESKCHIPSVVMKLFEESVFCLQPQGDSFTRRSIFDSMLAGCIPVFFHVHSAYTQYVWHLPQNRSKYSVFLPEDDIRRRNVSIEKLLLSIPSEKIHSMREEVIKLIPGLLYADPRSRLETMKDAFDISVQAVIDRVTDLRFRILEGRDMDETIDYGEGNDDEEGNAPGKEEESRRWEGQRRKGEQEGAEHGKKEEAETLEEIWQRDKEEKEVKRSLERTDSS